MINIYQPSLGKEELNAIKEVFDSNWLGKGPKTDEFIKQIATKLISDTFDGIGCSYASTEQLMTVSCCTEGVFQIIDLLDIKEGDEVILPSVSFVGIANAIINKKAKPVFCDVDKHTLNPTSDHILEKITLKTKAIIILHYAGVPCDMYDIVKLCKEKNIILIEDNANSPFSSYNGQSTGTFGDYGVWSFDAMKILVTGDGGLIYAKNKNNIEKLKRSTYLGLETASGLSNTIDKKWWEFNISVPGRRSITNDIQAAIGLEQLKKVDNFIARRKEIHEMYENGLKDLDWIILPNIPKYVHSSYYMYHIQTEHRDELAKYLRKNDIYTTFRYYPLHWVEFYDCNDKLPNTDYAANNTLCIPIHQSLSNVDVNKIIKTIRRYKNEL